MIKNGLQKLVEGRNLSSAEAEEIMKEIMSGTAVPTQIASFLTALKMKGETVEEISAFAKVMKKHCRRIHPCVSGRLVDTCGTGGDKIKTFNISTASAFIAAGAGITVAKHGNRAITSKSGSADVMEKLGLNLNMSPEAVEEAIEKVGIGFMFAPVFHPAMKYATGPRRELGFRTIFNILGPLTNPADANAQLLGVYHPTLTEPLAYTLKNLGCHEAMVVHGLDGLDEISTIGKTIISWLKDEEVTTIQTRPKDFGIKLARYEDIKGVTPDNSAQIAFKIVNNCCERNDPKREIALVNGAAGIIVGGKAEDFGYGLDMACSSIESGAAYKKLKELVKASKGNLLKLEELEQRYDGFS